jgi:DNA-binding transcriptional regulator YiaG
MLTSSLKRTQAAWPTSVYLIGIRRLADLVDLPLASVDATLIGTGARCMAAKRRVEYVIEWDAEQIKALRDHLGMTQQQLAEELGVRQQTISEWEVGVYMPRRSTSKYLSLIAERAGFAYKVKK